jgi:dTDP-4-amino-4,6-dideoxy-D-galactose acyltransferase
MSSVPLCQYLKWDSEFFGRRIARANVNGLSKEVITEIEAWCAEQKIECLYFLAASADGPTASLAQDHRFRLVDVRVTLDLKIGSISSGPANLPFLVRNAREADIQALRAIARHSHRDSRFYYDENFPRLRCDELYETWIEKSCRGRSKKVFAAEEGGEIKGYLSCDLANPGCGQIGLVGVSERAQGQGIGRGLVSHAICWFAQEGVESIRVVTQGRNVRAQRLYQKCGFATCLVELWFHRWFFRTRKSE